MGRGNQSRQLAMVSGAALENAFRKIEFVTGF